MKKTMMVRVVSILSVLLSVAVLVSVLFLREESTGILYRVSGGKQDMYLLGSIHVGSRDMYPFGDAIQTAMQDADVLVFECDTQSEAAAEETSQLMRYAEDDALHNHVSEACMADVRKVAQKLGYDVNEMENLKPWAVTSLLSMDTLSAEMGTQDVHDAVALGVETAVRKEIGNRRTVYLETAGEQLRTMDSFTPPLQEYLLASACRDLLSPETAVDEELSQWPKWWKSGNAQAFSDSYLAGLAKEEEPELAQEYHQTLITSRNQRMAQKLASLLESGDRCFVTVGLMHLVLPQDSILAELASMGYQVEKIEN